MMSLSRKLQRSVIYITYLVVPGIFMIEKEVLFYKYTFVYLQKKE